MLILLKRIFSAIAAMCLLAAFTVSDASGAEDISSKAAILYEAVTGTVLYEKEPDARLPIASTTKIMTALVTVENASLDEVVEIPAQCENVEGSSMYLRAGEKLTVRELLYGLMLSSGNDAAVALALHISGSIEGFAGLMNRRAAELGLENTHFMNPHGLSEDGHYSSARDLALIMAEAMEDPRFAQIASTKTVSFGTRSLTNHNKLMWSYDGMLAGKTGYTKMSGRTLVTCAQRDGMRLICVTLDDGDDWNDHVKLYDMGFEGWRILCLAKAGQECARVPVISGVEDEAAAAPAESVNVLVPAGAQPSVRVSVPDFVYAGVRSGDRAGYLTAELDGKELCRAELVFTGDVPRDGGQLLSGAEKLRRLRELF